MYSISTFSFLHSPFYLDVSFGTALRFAHALQLDFSPELRERSKEKVARSKEEGESNI